MSYPIFAISRLHVANLAVAITPTVLAANENPSRSGGLDEVVVTAERIEGSLQETPISLTVFDAKTLEALGVVETGDIAAYTPNLRMDKTPVSLNGYAISIRGVNSSEPSLAVDPTVGIYVDGVYLGRNSASAFEVVDLERIEVLRGPQGTLYGRNTIGGAVNVITAKPSGEFGFKQEFTVGENELFRSSSSLDTAKYGDFAAKLSYSYGERGGIYESSYTGGDLGQYDQQAWRAALRWTPGDRLTADYVYDHYQQDSNTNTAQISYVRPLHVALGGTLYEQYLAASSADRLDKLPYYADNKDQTLEIDGHALTLAYEIGDATLKSISSYREFDNHYDGADFGAFPADGTSVLTPNFDGSLVPVGTPVHNFNSVGFNEQEQWSQELQLSGRTLGDRLGYMMGLYYFHEEGTNRDPSTFALPALFVVGEMPQDTQDYLCAGACFGKSMMLGAPVFEYSTDNDAGAAYGQFDYALTETLTAVVGLRWSVDEKWASLTYGFNDVGTATVDSDHSWDNVSPTFMLTWTPNEDTMLYAKYASGYRAGGYNIRAATTTAFSTPVDEEQVDSYEIGAKSEWFDHRVRLNGAVFHYTYTDQQVGQFEAGTGGASSTVVNAGESEANGIELELTVAPVDGLLVMLNYGHVEVEYNEFITSVFDPVSGFPVFDANGDAVTADVSDDVSTISGGPEDTAAMIVQYSFPHTAIGTPVLQVDASYAGERTFSTQLYLYNSTDSYTLWNARLALTEIPVPHGQLSVALWGRNLGDEEVREFGIDFGALGFTSNTYKELRSVGADLRYEF